MKRSVFVTIGGFLSSLFLACFLILEVGCKCDPIIKVVKECDKAFVSLHARFVGVPETEKPTLVLETLEGVAAGGGLPCLNPANCGDTYQEEGMLPGTYRAYALYKSKRYYFTNKPEPVTVPNDLANAATIKAEAGKSYALNMTVQP